jgi:hypothetical protein
LVQQQKGKWLDRDRTGIQHLPAARDQRRGITPVAKLQAAEQQLRNQLQILLVCRQGCQRLSQLVRGAGRLSRIRQCKPGKSMRLPL